MKFKIIITLLCLSSFQIQAQEINKTEAIRIAENYVLEQGYSKKRLENKNTSIDTLLTDKYFSFTADEMADARFNTLKPNAFYSKEVSKGWLIGFRYTKMYIKRKKAALKDNLEFNKMLNEHRKASFLPKVKSKNEFALLVSYKGEVTVLPYSNLRYYARKYKIIKKEINN